MVTIHIYGAIAVLLLFWDHQDTKNELCKIEISTYQQILNNKKISEVLWDNDIWRVPAQDVPLFYTPYHLNEL